MSERRFCTVRFNLDKPKHRKAWDVFARYEQDESISHIPAAMNVQHCNNVF